MLGNFGDFLGDATDFTTMFPTKQNGFRGIMKVLLGANCHSTAGAALTKTPEHIKLDAIFTALVANWKIKDSASLRVLSMRTRIAVQLARPHRM